MEQKLEQEKGIFISLVSMLLGFGCLMVYSASITSWPTEYEQVYLSRHMIYLCLGVTIAAVCSHIPSRIWFKLAPLLFAVSLLFLLLVLVPGMGKKVNGAQRWLRLGGLSFQPSEMAKITLVLYVSRLLVLNRERLNQFWHGAVRVLIPPVLVIPLVMIEPDLGTSLFLAMGIGIVLFSGGWPKRYFFLAGAVAIPSFLLLLFSRPYMLKRIHGLLATWTDFNLAPYQIKQSMISLGSGGIWGVGLGKGLQKLSFLPEANTDFVFAVVGEELGLVGTCAILFLWCNLYVAGLKIIKKLEMNSFEFIVAFTLLTMTVIQAVTNVAVVTAMVPPKGIPHPFLSSGGTNLLMNLASLGIVLSMAKNKSVKSL
jgi:cell division protein FtsW